MTTIAQSGVETRDFRVAVSSDRVDMSRGRLPHISKFMLRWFTWYSRRYVRRHFHTLRISRAGRPPETAGLPVVIYTNHASWWDALLCLVLKDEFFRERDAYAPIDAAMLGHYKMFRKLGFFGVQRKSHRGAAEFLRTAEAILRLPASLLVLTPQGRFVDLRERPVRFEAGLGHLAARTERALFVPLAVEYVFWEERLPEILLRFGERVEVCPRRHPLFDARYWTTLFQERLGRTQDALAREAMRRDPEDFNIILRGESGQGGIYDVWRSVRAKMRGEEFHREHGLK